jgi:hypothetical protein
LPLEELERDMLADASPVELLSVVMGKSPKMRSRAAL